MRAAVENSVAGRISQTGRVILDDSILALDRAQLMELVASRPQTGDATVQPGQPVADVPPNADQVRTLLIKPGNALHKVLEGLAGGGFGEKIPGADSFFRKGQVGNWREGMGDTLAEKLIVSHREVMHRFAYMTEVTSWSVARFGLWLWSSCVACEEMPAVVSFFRKRPSGNEV